MVVCAGVMGATGFGLLAAVAGGRFGRRFLRFDPAGLTLGEHAVEYQVARNSIADVAEYRRVDISFIGFNIADLDEEAGVSTGQAQSLPVPADRPFLPPGLRVTPVARASKLLQRLCANCRREGRHVVICPLHLGLDSGALAGTVIGLCTAEVIHPRGSWTNIDDRECATLEWVDWFNCRRLLQPIGDIPPADPKRSCGQQQSDLDHEP